MKWSRIPTVFAIVIIGVSSLGISMFSWNIIELFLFAEFISIASIYLFLTILIPALFPKKSDPEAIFIGGAGKPPYVSADEIYSPSLPIFEEEITEE
jgi:hypothetical protein